MTATPYPIVVNAAAGMPVPDSGRAVSCSRPLAAGFGLLTPRLSSRNHWGFICVCNSLASARDMASDRSQKYRHLANECLTQARQSADTQARASLIAVAQRWLDLAEIAEHDAAHESLRRRGIQRAIGDELKKLFGLSSTLPPHILSLLAEMNAASNNGGCAQG
jgi:hypothetical protein